MQISAKSVIVSRNGGLIDIVSPDGEVLSSLPVPAGRVRAAEFLDLIPAGAHVQLGEGLELHSPRSGVAVQAYGEGSHDTGANPDFQPTSASRLEREMRLGIARMQQATSRVEARERALARIERIPTAPLVEDIRQDDPPAPVEAQAEQIPTKKAQKEA